MMRELSLTLLQKTENRLPLSKVEYSVQMEDVLDLSEYIVFGEGRGWLVLFSQLI